MKQLGERVFFVVHVVIIQKKINFRQNTAIWTQSMCTHNLTQAQDPLSYTHDVRSIQPQNQPCTSLCFVLTEFFSIIPTRLKDYIT